MNVIQSTPTKSTSRAIQKSKVCPSWKFQLSNSFLPWPLETNEMNSCLMTEQICSNKLEFTSHVFCCKTYIEETDNYRHDSLWKSMMMRPMFSFLLWKEMVQSRLNQHLNVSVTTWKVIPVLLITKQLFCEDALVLQGPSSFGHWENKMQLQIINNIQRLIRSVLISKTFRLELNT